MLLRLAYLGVTAAFAMLRLLPMSERMFSKAMALWYAGREWRPVL